MIMPPNLPLRSAFDHFRRQLWGRDGAPDHFRLTSWLFLRLLGLIYFSAFVSFGVQATGLIGNHGILPLPELIAALNGRLGPERYGLAPMLFWLDSSDFFIQAVCWAGAALSLLLAANILPRISLALLYILYLSLIYAGQDFMTFQWDILLVEAGFLGLLLSFAPRPGILLLRWLAFRFVFLSGVVKIASGDAAWRDLSALSYHFLTQPLPTPIAWYAHHLPAAVLMLMCFATLFIELIAPFFIFLSRRWCFAAAFCILALQTAILLTGNYNFFNLTSMLLCLTLFDDAALQAVLPAPLIRFMEKRPARAPGKITSSVVGAVALFLLLVSGIQLFMVFGGKPFMLLTTLERSMAPFHLVNTYGPFAVMTVKREEIIIEGSDDSERWKEYGFKYKPGDIARGLPWNIPHQPRLDWQMWFAALESPARILWFSHFMQRLLEGEKQVTDLLEINPFPAHPPLYVRALLYDYRFTSPEEKAKSGHVWERELVGVYYPEVRFK